ncbi:MAG: auxin-binding protein [Pseudomonadales bacterium]|nr:auxin-binding protein [Pseudomonadales bacterium]
MFNNFCLLGKLLPAIVFFAATTSSAGDNPDFELQTDSGLSLHLHSQLQPLVINQIHSWHLELNNSSGLVEDATITVEGGMPEHDHGLPTQPQVTAEISPGVYLIEGIRFHMPGAWQMLFTIQVDGRTTEATLEFQL